MNEVDDTQRQEMLDRIPPEWGKWLEIPDDWFDIVYRCHVNLETIDPDYVIHQVKEKFGWSAILL